MDKIGSKSDLFMLPLLYAFDHFHTSLCMYLRYFIFVFLTSLMKVKQNALKKYMCITTKVY